MVASDSGVEFADLLINAIPQASIRVADSKPDLTHHRLLKVTGTKVQGSLTRTPRV